MNVTSFLKLLTFSYRALDLTFSVSKQWQYENKAIMILLWY